MLGGMTSGLFGTWSLTGGRTQTAVMVLENLVCCVPSMAGYLVWIVWLKGLEASIMSGQSK